jgi:S-adenosylmethionine:tRNA ribosyltransferase-isomerase
MHLNEFDYILPEELIAQHPTDKRDDSRLLVLDRKLGTITHQHFYNIVDYLEKGDCLVLNNSKVLPARLYGIKTPTGAKVEFLLTRRLEGDLWETMVHPGKRLHPGDEVVFSEDGSFKAIIKDYGADGTRHAEFSYSGLFLETLEKYGKMPLPPYIDRANDLEDKDRYQTVYSKINGSVAAPTAGLHFTQDLLSQIEAKGIHLAYVTLHVGIGTFRPVKCDVIEEHKMHFEEYEIDVENAAIINKAKSSGGRIISIGTTSTRTLESAVDDQGRVIQGRGNTEIFIYPGYKFRVVDSLVTNFHLPKSTLLMLVSAFSDRETILKAYDEAIMQKYRFFSYGDAMYIK